MTAGARMAHAGRYLSAEHVELLGGRLDRGAHVPGGRRGGLVLLTAAEAAGYVPGRSIAWMRSVLADGTIPGARKVRSRWMVPRRDLERWIEAGCPQAPRAPLRDFPRVVAPLRGRRAA